MSSVPHGLCSRCISGCWGPAASWDLGVSSRSPQPEAQPTEGVGTEEEGPPAAPATPRPMHGPLPAFTAQSGWGTDSARRPEGRDHSHAVLSWRPVPRSWAGPSSLPLSCRGLAGAADPCNQELVGPRRFPHSHVPTLPSPCPTHARAHAHTAQTTCSPCKELKGFRTVRYCAAHRTGGARNLAGRAGGDSPWAGLLPEASLLRLSPACPAPPPPKSTLRSGELGTRAPCPSSADPLLSWPLNVPMPPGPSVASALAALTPPLPSQECSRPREHWTEGAQLCRHLLSGLRHNGDSKGATRGMR